MTTASATGLPDFKPAPNQGGNIELYEVENQALDPGGHVLAAMRARAPWAGRTLLDLGCGSGYWLARYAGEAAEVIGVEPDPRLLPLAASRDPRARVLRMARRPAKAHKAPRVRKARRVPARASKLAMTTAATPVARTRCKRS